jgi:hypothetical protein
LISLWLLPISTVRQPLVFRTRLKLHCHLQLTGDRDSQDVASILLELALMVALFHSTPNQSLATALARESVPTTDKSQIVTAQLAKEVE